MTGTTETPIEFEKDFLNIIDGKPRNGKQIHQSTNPSDGKPLWDVPIASAEDLDDAVKAAQKAFQTWSRTKWEDRVEIIKKIVDEFQKYENEMANILMLEAGKPFQFAKMEIGFAVDGLKYFSEVTATEPSFPDEVTSDDKDVKIIHRWAPLGVVGAICPWNFPLAISMNKIGPALLTGSCIIMKPSPFTPYSILKFTEIAQRFLPPGVLQALNGDDKMGPMMTEHPGIAKISFTGSSPTGKRVMASCAKTLKRVTLELGGNSAAIICPDVDVNKVAFSVALGAFFNSGQLCVASKRLYVHEDIYDDMLKALTNVVKSWKTGGTHEEGVMLGPVQNYLQHKIVKDFFEDCASNGYEFALPGSVDEGKGFVIQPAIVNNPPDSARIVREEQFGPIVPMMKWKDEDDVIARVNDSDTGLGGAVYSADTDYAQKLGNRIEAGTIWINSNEKPLASAYFSGQKESGLGGEGGRHGLYEYMVAQVTHLYKNDVAKSA
ncbi:hypothetical protein HYALB_00008246 [Hymenoscyphus albidus]|uniref:aldehyde dehydrogenase (NAD(+)) n=1 Tax=Hymenoscyphus albidus TaxID=595503 RepID=A0A9N9LMH8_9HELO|nr:hypothetical protein HYALB_00008246 [Hymenoscyphus albidus]